MLHGGKSSWSGVFADHNGLQTFPANLLPAVLTLSERTLGDSVQGSFDSDQSHTSLGASGVGKFFRFRSFCPIPFVLRFLYLGATGLLLGLRDETPQLLMLCFQHTSKLLCRFRVHFGGHRS